MSKLIACPSCDGAISQRAKVCSHCGYPLKSFFGFCRTTVIVMAFLYVGFHGQMHALVGDIPDPLHGFHKFLDDALGLQSDGESDQEVRAIREEKLDPPVPSRPKKIPAAAEPRTPAVAEAP